MPTKQTTKSVTIPVTEETDLVNTVFRNPAGEKLLALWRDVYIMRPSYEPGRPVEEAIYFEGQRSQVLSIIQHLERVKK